MLAIVGGLGAAFLWATSTLTSSRAGRLIGPYSTCGWMMLVSVLVATPLALVTGPVPQITPEIVPWALISGIGGMMGLQLTYVGLRYGKVGVVGALASTEGAIAAVISVLAGEKLTLPVAVVLMLLAAGVAVVALATDESEAAEHGPDQAARARRAVLFGSMAALFFGFSIYGTAQLGKTLSPFAAVLPVRLAGLIGIWLPLALSGKLRMTRAAVPMVILIGVCEVVGNAFYVVGTSQSIAITAVLASQFAGIGAIAAFFFFHERLSVTQRSGVVAIAAGVAVLTLVR